MSSVTRALSSYKLVSKIKFQFKTSQQATSVVSHRVYISNDLQIKISLNGSTITSKAFPGDFAKNKQV